LIFVCKSDQFTAFSHDFLNQKIFQCLQCVLGFYCAMPKRSGTSSVDKREHIYAPSSSSDEDWGDDEWEVKGIIGEHTAERGDRQ
jgi:hypothetical protein